MIAVVFHVPTVYPDGSYLSQHFLNGLLDEVYHFAGGLSYLEGMGAWRNPENGERVLEPILRVHVGVEEQQVNDLIELVEGWLKGPFHQQAVWLEVDGTPEIR
jgi:hypothetical protein